MAIVSSSIIKSYCSMSDADYTAYGSYIHNAIEKFIKNYCSCDFEATTYQNEMYDGGGRFDLYLDHKPINYVSRLAITREDAIKIKNTMTDATSVIIRIDATNCTLVVDGGTGNGSNALALATYTTLTLLVDAINALSAKGWVAELCDNDFSDIKTTILLPQTINFTTWKAGTATPNYLQIAGEPVDFEIYANEGYLHRDGGFGYGNKNVVITYNAEATPSDIGYAVQAMVTIINNARVNNSLDVVKWRTDEIEMQYGQIRELMPASITQILDIYKRIHI